MILYILILVLMALLLWLMLAPVNILMDSDRKIYQLALPGIIKASFVPYQDFFYVKGRIFFIPLKIDPFKKRMNKMEDQHGVKRETPKKRIGNIKMIRAAIRTFRIRKLMLDIDTDDFILNAALVPVFSGINSRNIMLQVNFEGNSSLHLETRTRIGSLLWILFKYR